MTTFRWSSANAARTSAPSPMISTRHFLTFNKESPQPLIWSSLVKLRMSAVTVSTNEDPSDLEWRFHSRAKQSLWTNCPFCLWTPKSSSSPFTRLDNLVLKAGILFAQWLLSALIASDLMGDCDLLVDSGGPRSVMAMAKQHRETKLGWALVPVITG